MQIPVTESSNDSFQPECVEVTIVGFAAHVAYLEPVTGTGLVVAPLPDADVAASGEWLEVASRSKSWSQRPTVGLSLQTADRTHALEQLAGGGWTLLEDEGGEVEIVGRTTGGRVAACLYAVRTTDHQLVLEDFHRAFVALQIAADLCHRQ